MRPAARRTVRSKEPLELCNGDRMTREEFNRLYEQTPPDFKAELIGGIVYVASPPGRPHGTHHVRIATLFGIYEFNTPGVEAGDKTTLLLGDEAEPQPDLYLRILPECGGQSRTTAEDYVKGAPELVAEVASSSRAIDLHGKRLDYARYGVREYLVLSLRERQLRWFDLRADRELAPDPDGIIRVHSFPGLWIDVAALLHKDPRLTAVVAEGLATAEHAAFAQALAQAASGSARGRRRKGSARQPRRKRRGERNDHS
jgi:Uma2 family endonuclease